MYLEFYNLKTEPFRITPDPEFLYLSSGHQEALAAISYAVQQGKGFMALVGEVGLGKTTLLQAFLKQRGESREKIIYLFNSRFSFTGLLRALGRELDLETDSEDTQVLLDSIYQGLIQEYAQGNSVILLVDEAQGMPEETLEGLRLISNLETPTDKLLQIVLVGQPELEAKLERYELRQLRQRIAVRAALSPLSPEESLEYLHFRVEKAGGKVEEIFTPRALEEIVRRARGIPRALNILADNALVTGFGYQQKPVNVKVVREIIADQEGGRPAFFRRLAPAMVLVSLLTALAALGVSVYYRSPVPVSRVTVPLNPADTAGPRNGAALEREDFLPALQKQPEEKEDLSPSGPRTPPGRETLGPAADRPTSLPVARETGPPLVEDPPVPAKEDGRLQESTGPFPQTRTVRQGQNLYRMILEVYGTSNPELWALVRQHNPRIKEDLKILVGQKIVFPKWE
ncbi:MAG: AAA family ATPase [Deltaproteobacteria bacterium]|nr:AAA family ATPase [Deltaproteobacteria bacterium]